jgi:large repetitive protein
MANPTYQSGFYAPGRGVAKHPELWRGCVGAWDPGLGNTGLVLRDWSGNQNNGTLTNGPTWETSGGRRALDFDGTNDYVDCGDINAIDGASAFTWSIWFKPNAWANNDFVMEKGSVFTLGKHSSITGANGGFTISDGAWKPVNFATTPTLGTWTHVLATLSGATLSLYVDGVFVASRADIGTVASSANSFNIGGRSTFFPFNGQIADVRIYNRALSPSQIQTLAQRPGIAYERAPRKFYSLPAAASSGNPTGILINNLQSIRLGL